MSWFFQEITIGQSAEVPIPIYWPEDRPDDYDPDKTWDEDSGKWVSVESGGGGRLKNQLIVVGSDDSGNGIVYFGST